MEAKKVSYYEAEERGKPWKVDLSCNLGLYFSKPHPSAVWGKPSGSSGRPVLTVQGGLGDTGMPFGFPWMAQYTCSSTDQTLPTAGYCLCSAHCGGWWRPWSSCAQQSRSHLRTSLCGCTLWPASRGLIRPHTSRSHAMGWLNGVLCVGTAENPELAVTALGLLREVDVISASQTAGIKPSYGVISFGSKHLENPRWWLPT